MLIFLLCVSIILWSLNLWARRADKIEKRRFYATRDALLDVVLNHAQRDSGIQLPTINSQRVYNAERDKEELVFVEYASDGRTRDIYVTLDGEYIHLSPWKTK